MNILRNATALFFIVSTYAFTQAGAQEVEYKAVEEKNILSGKASIDPAKGYILVTSRRRSEGVFFKAPEEDDIVAYQATLEEAFEDAVKSYARSLKSWTDRQERGGSSGGKPVEPNRETFFIGGIESRMLVTYGPQYVFSKDTSSEDDLFSYLIEVEPGNYTYYGPLAMIPQPMGVCYCMGSVKFDVPAGQITNFGDFPSQGWADAEALAQASIGAPSDRVARPMEYPVPASLEGYSVIPSDLYAAGKVNNFFGVLVARIPPIEGVLAYDRDRVIDLRSSEIEDRNGQAEQGVGEVVLN